MENDFGNMTPLGSTKKTQSLSIMVFLHEHPALKLSQLGEIRLSQTLVFTIETTNSGT